MLSSIGVDTNSYLVGVPGGLLYGTNSLIWIYCRRNIGDKVDTCRKHKWELY